MEIAKVIGIGLVAAILALTLRAQKPEMALLVSLSAGVVLLFAVTGKFYIALGVLEEMANKAGLSSEYLKVIVQIIGVSYLTEFGAQVCKDAGEGSIASKIELGGKIALLIMSLPILTSLLDVVLEVLP